jgi:hypothetical protein
MANSPNLGLPYIAANQAQKHIPHNDALATIDGLLQMSVVSRGLNAPPSSFADGNRFLVGPTPTGAWASHAGSIALTSNGQWQFLSPQAGWLLWVVAENIFLVFNGATWAAPPPPTTISNLVGLGVNATPDTTNKLSVNSSAALFNNIGNGIQIKLNKNATTDTASLLYQTGFSGRAELGTAGDDSFHFKVSADGSTWNEALVIDQTTGLACVLADPALNLGIATKQYVDANAAKVSTINIQSLIMN